MQKLLNLNIFKKEEYIIALIFLHNIKDVKEENI